jgi:hypothetical protein
MAAAAILEIEVRAINPILTQIGFKMAKQDGHRRHFGN